MNVLDSDLSLERKTFWAITGGCHLLMAILFILMECMSQLRKIADRRESIPYAEPIETSRRGSYGTHVTVTG